MVSRQPERKITKFWGTIQVNTVANLSKYWMNGQSKNVSDSACLPGRVLPFLWQMVLFSFDRAAEEVWVLLLCLKTSSEVMFDRGKFPPALVMWELAKQIKVVFQKGAVGTILIQKCCKTLITTWFFALNRIANCFFATFCAISFSPWTTCLFFSFFPSRFW